MVGTEQQQRVVTSVMGVWYGLSRMKSRRKNHRNKNNMTPNPHKWRLEPGFSPLQALLGFGGATYDEPGMGPARGFTEQVGALAIVRVWQETRGSESLLP